MTHSTITSSLRYANVTEKSLRDYHVIVAVKLMVQVSKVNHIINISHIMTHIMSHLLIASLSQ